VPEAARPSARQITLVEAPGDERVAWMHALHAAGWQVTCCASTHKALEQIERMPPDVLVCEVNPAPADSPGLLKLVKKRRPETQVICTARIHEAACVLECLRSGAADYLRRPIDPADLVEAAEEALLATPEDEAIEIELGELGWIELRMPSSEHSMKRLNKFFRLLYETDLPPDTLDEVSVCFLEVVKNAIEWGHRFDISKRILVSHMLFQDEIVFKVRDTGEGFDLETVLEGPHDMIAVEAGRAAVGKRLGGLGITMVKGLMDTVVYNKSGNMIVMSKRIYDGS